MPDVSIYIALHHTETARKLIGGSYLPVPAIPGGRAPEHYRMQSGSESDPADHSMAARCVSPLISNATIAAGGVIQRPRRVGSGNDDDDDPGGPGGPGGFGAQTQPYNPTPSPWASYRGTYNQYGRPAHIPSQDGSESNGPVDGSVRRIMASGLREMKKTL